MPQMAPLMWLTLLTFFIMMLIIFLLLNYFNLLYKPISTKNKKMFNKLNSNWSW